MAGSAAEHFGIEQLIKLCNEAPLEVLDLALGLTTLSGPTAAALLHDVSQWRVQALSISGAFAACALPH